MLFNPKGNELSGILEELRRPAPPASPVRIGLTTIRNHSIRSVRPSSRARLRPSAIHFSFQDDGEISKKHLYFIAPTEEKSILTRRAGTIVGLPEKLLTKQPNEKLD